MIVYRDNKASKRQTPPWLVGASDLIIREDTANFDIKYYGIGPAHSVGAGDKWTDLGDGYDARIVGELSSYLLTRHLPFVPVSEAMDMMGRGWHVPQVLNEDVPLIIPTYDDNYLPVYNTEQQRIIDIAKAARAALRSGGVDMSVAGRWTAELICCANHISEKALLRLNLLDNALVLTTLQVATGCDVKSQVEEV
jgi:hypothetical protein